MTKQYSSLIVLSSFLSLSACSGAVDIGGEEKSNEENPNEEEEEDDGEPKSLQECLDYEAANPPEPVVSPFEDPVAIEVQVGTWLGFVQHGSEVALELDAQGGGSLVFGDTSVTPSSEPTEFGHREGPALVLEPVEGFSYTIYNLSTSEERVRFALDMNEPFRAWCSARIPQFQADVCSWGCFSHSDITGDFASGMCEDEPACIEVAACMQSCRCTSAGCEPTTSLAKFDGNVADGVLRGTFDDGFDGQDGEVTLTQE